jgi:phospholipid/cholesterol/gamma-HCH transport system permease protein
MAAGTAPSPARPRGGPVVRLLREVGDIVAFSGRAVFSAGDAWRYFAEILRQCSLLIVGSTVVILGLVTLVGGECGLFNIYLLRSIGASGFLGFTTAICGVREAWPYMFAYVFAAKVGCGLVAEIGSMRINQEIDAMESVGVDPMRYVVATRLLAVWMTVPVMYVTAMVFGTLGSYLVVVAQIGEVSRGQWETLHFASQTLSDNLFSVTKVMTFATVIALVGMYYGYRTRGGPVGVGDATARSMVVNLVLIHIVGSLLSAVFWGTTGRLAIGG